jgi:hypothetical protein
MTPRWLSDLMCLIDDEKIDLEGAANGVGQKVQSLLSQHQDSAWTACVGLVVFFTDWKRRDFYAAAGSEQRDQICFDFSNERRRRRQIDSDPYLTGSDLVDQPLQDQKGLAGCCRSRRGKPLVTLGLAPEALWKPLT